MTYRLAALLVLAIALPGIAQDFTTTPVGTLRNDLPVGRSAVGLPLINYATKGAVCISLAGHTLTVRGVPPSTLPNRQGLPQDTPSYIEVLEGPLKGDRFEVDVHATLAADFNTIVLDPASPLNSLPIKKIGTALNGHGVSLHPHITLAQILSFCNPPLLGSDFPEEADQIAIPSPDGKSITSFYLTSDSLTWKELGSDAPSNTVPIPPGTGFFLTKRLHPTTLDQVGQIRTSDFAVNQPTGLHLAASPFATSPPPEAPKNSLPSDKKNLAKPTDARLILSNTPDHTTVLINPFKE